MKFKNYTYKRRGGIVEIIIWDENYNKEDTFKWNRNDKKLEKAIAEILFAKHNIDLSRTLVVPNPVEEKDNGFFDS